MTCTKPRNKANPYDRDDCERLATFTVNLFIDPLLSEQSKVALCNAIGNMDFRKEMEKQTQALINRHQLMCKYVTPKVEE